MKNVTYDRINPEREGETTLDDVKFRLAKLKAMNLLCMYPGGKDGSVEVYIKNNRSLFDARSDLHRYIQRHMKADLEFLIRLVEKEEKP